jgi:hypothetical protein
VKRPIGVVLLVLALAGCSADRSILEQGARFPDDEGVVTDITLERMELEDERSFTIVPKVESFKTRSHEPASLLALEGRYVHVGLNEDDEVEWIASVGVVGQDLPSVLYTGVFERIDRETSRAVFADGTTLRVDDDLESPEEGAEQVATIDARSHRVVSLQPASSRSSPSS